MTRMSATTVGALGMWNLAFGIVSFALAVLWGVGNAYCCRSVELCYTRSSGVDAAWDDAALERYLVRYVPRPSGAVA